MKSQFIALKSKSPIGLSVNEQGYLSENGNEIDSFSIGQAALQLRYKYEFAPLSNLYIVYTRGGKLTNPFNQEDNFKDIYSDAWTNETLDKFIVKLRLNF